MSEEKTLFIQNDNPMNVAARKKAFDGALIKWETIMHSLTPLWESSVKCEICSLFRLDNVLISPYGWRKQTDVCAECPLMLVECCLEDGSTFKRFHLALKAINKKRKRQIGYWPLPNEISDCTPEEQETLKTLCRKIIENIEKASDLNER